METARSAAPEGMKTDRGTAEDAAQTAPSHPVQLQQTQTAPADSAPEPLPPESGRSAAAASAQDTGRGSVLQEFLSDGPPEVQESRREMPAEERPVQMQDGTTAGEGEEAPLETATEEGPISGGVSIYRDIFDDMGLDPLPAVGSGRLAGDATLPGDADPVVGQQFGSPLVLSSLVDGTSAQDVDVPPLAPVTTNPTEPDPLTEQRLAAGEDPDGSSSGDEGDGDDDEGADDDSLTGNDNLSGADAGETGEGERLQLSDVTDGSGDSTADLAALDDDTANVVARDAGAITPGFTGSTGAATFDDLAAHGVNVDIA